ncbi:bifunctional PTS fructose transporter subunit IIA/HPr protein [Vibrio breoganii]|uniref:fused PTS fructose transporter subunit IIA/HPr protein n=1 Tax=Vibrio breoganii TaxID=553239 RepID=UPI000CB96E2B|nr:fused PTS fructose transporter subunit IIA/HPr protein [Vibrio breoganii]PMG81727.1 bifunctional PTS fructose transporter subunit IIA/HPr protein [Vibrio breoganii]PMK40926.1 bifunctional PTS fructose transporter subunit IIA/HPr protein [Vibrio breoganii]PMO34076.1 bifunctional PTS fructose transporter subunit IIA/HPr protein [Vibrio breoganii]PMO54095.1 bifunctional PTS fructose transporter subunit IIA/HPr protein [Vibrio breoganii]
MLTINENDIRLQKSAADKAAAIQDIAKTLTSKNLVDAGYVEGMLNRESQNSTFLGNGIAIPHGTVDTRSLVHNTGVAVHHFPEGVDWGDGNTVFLAIGIAAKSDEHLGILKQLTKVLSADSVEDKLKQAENAQQIIALLNGEVQLKADFDASLIQLNFPASDMLQMAAVTGGLLKNTGCVENEFVADLVTKSPTHLGQGLWLVASDNGAKRTAMSFVTTSNQCEFEGALVKGLVAFSANSDVHQSMLNILVDTVASGKQNELLQASAERLITLFSGEESPASSSTESPDNSAVFTIKNAHGLHARPGAMLVAEAKKFESKITVCNLDGEAKPVNAKSLMKVIAMGVKHGHQLQFSADGSDAKQALESIGKAIESGLGEG